MRKRPKMCRSSCSSSSSSHLLFPRDFSGPVADTVIINTPPEPFRPTDVPFGDYKAETKDSGRIFWLQNRFLAVVAPSSE